MRQRDIAYSDSPIRRSIVEVFAIPSLALCLLWRHLPQLVTAICLGLAGRQAVIWIAVGVSSFSSLAAMLIMPLAPACVMASMIFALWFVQPSLATMSTRAQPSGQAHPAQWLAVGALLIPFLSAYSAHGLLRDDFATFRYAASTTEFAQRGFSSDTGRALIDSFAVLVALTAVTIVLRRLIGYRIAQKGPGHLLGFISAYLEVLWMVTGSTFLTFEIQRWLTSRRSFAPTLQEFREVSSGFGADTGSAVLEAVAWFSTQWPYLLQFLAVPISWLTLAVVVYGPQQGGEELNNEGRTRSDFQHRALRPVTEPIMTTWGGLRVLGRTGILPVVVFCLLFTLASFLETGSIRLGRAIVGPQDELASEVAASYILITAKTIYLLVVVCLVASAVDNFARRTRYFSLEPTRSSKNGFDSGSLTVT